MERRPSVVSLVWNLIRGGTEGQCARVAMGLAARGAKHRVAVFRREGFFLDAVEAACGPVFHLDIRRLLASATLAHTRRFSMWLRDTGVDILHTWDADAAIFGSLAARWAGIPLITSRRDLGEIYPRHKVWLLHRADRAAAAVVANAGAIADRFSDGGLPRGKVRVIGNILDLEEFDQLAIAAPPRTLPSGRLVGLVARLDPEKDVASFVRAAGRVLAECPDVQAVIAGDGPERGALERAAVDTGFSDRIHFLGDIPWVPALVRRLAVGVLTPIRNEGLSNTLLEYMAAGIPFVATDCGGNRELSDAGRCGRIVAAGDADALARALIELLSRPDEGASMGRSGRCRIELQHRPSTVCEAFAELYRDVLRAAP
jgi:glycosyltransferase involved in cell wall biosynthesis